MPQLEPWILCNTQTDKFDGGTRNISKTTIKVGLLSQYVIEEYTERGATETGHTIFQSRSNNKIPVEIRLFKENNQGINAYEELMKVHGNKHVQYNIKLGQPKSRTKK